MTPRRTAALVATAVASVLVPAHPAAAASSVQAGWWTASPLAAAPDAPEDGLVVRGGTDGEQPEAYAAVEYVLEPDKRATSLRLTVAPSSVSTPDATLRLCLLSESFTPAYGGPIADAPAFDCSTATTAEPSADGSSLTTYEFDVAGFPQGGALAVAVVPAAATDRVVLERPGLNAVTLASTSSGGASGSPPFSAGADSPSFVPEPSAGTGSVVTSPPSSLDVPSPSQPEATGAAPTGSDEEAARGANEVAAPQFAAASDAAGDAGSLALRMAFIGLAVLAAALWSLAGRQPVPGGAGLE